MFAKTMHAMRLNHLSLLYASAVNLIHEKKRSAVQIEKLLNDLQEFKDNKETNNDPEYVALRVHKTHGGDIGNWLIIQKISDIREFGGSLPSLEPDSSVQFQAPGGGCSIGSVLFVLNRDQAAVINAVIAVCPAGI